MSPESSHASWYKEEPETIEPAIREVFEKHSKIPAERVAEHIKQVRDKAYQISRYPCIGGYYFLNLKAREAPCYPEVKKRVLNGEKLLDIGCCLGQEIRRMVTDGMPAENLYGCELKTELVNLGYELFLDKEYLASKFIVANIFETPSDLDQLDGKISIVHAQYFFHLFTWDEQLRLAHRLVRLSKPNCEFLVFGGHMGTDQETEGYHADTGKFFMHSHESWKRLWDQVGSETNTSWEVETGRQPADPNLLWLCGPEAYFMTFVVRRVQVSSG
ncbi:hypothetical protein COCVIDRAFT_11525 [Bipolaris victoriae FI3]|uniref:Uncharacterized protein n=1 Tax=Bipolaris victoriae (strain FI3) TaxID=930091 RepID=W7FA66_BIPV3|nr:hypothetical protein COCVIDRAFT_11525 [Bipolaris victoriae FI3]